MNRINSYLNIVNSVHPVKLASLSLVELVKANIALKEKVKKI